MFPIPSGLRLPERIRSLRVPPGAGLLLVILSLLAAACTGGGRGADFTPAASPTRQSRIVTPTAAASSTVTAAPTSSSTPTATAIPSATPNPTPTPAVLIGAGDISYCGEAHLGDEATADLLGQQLALYPHAQVFVAGDAVQGVGTPAEYRNCFGPTWGRYLERIHPVPGNHDYLTDGGAPYYAYFGASAGEPMQGYYSYDLGSWHIVALNSNCNDIACGADSRQAQWLAEDLAQSDARCTLLYWHYPRFSSGLAGGRPALATFWRLAAQAGAEIVVSGDDHDYERFAPLDGEGSPAEDGVRLFVAGTGGTTLRDWGEIQPHSEVRYNAGHGLLRFMLYPERYEWEFVPVELGVQVDSGAGTCH